MSEAVGRPKSWWKTQYALLAVILIVGAGFRIARSRFECLSFDEQWHMELSTGRGSIHGALPDDKLILDAPAATSLHDARPWYSVWTHITGAVHPPLYFVILRIWREIFGESDAAARSLSIIFSLGVIVLSFEIGRRLMGPEVGLGAAILFAVAPNQVYIAQQVRGYAMLQFTVAASMLAVICIEKSRRPSRLRAAIFGLCALAMMLTHYFAAGAVIAVGLYALIRLRGRFRLQAMMMLLAAAAIYAAIWLPWALPQRHFALSAGEWLEDTRSLAPLSTLARFATVPWREIAADGLVYIYHTASPLQEPWSYASAVLYVAPLFLLRRKPQLLLGYLWLACTIGFIAALDLTRSTTHLRFTRYIVLAAPGVFLLFTSLLALVPRWLGQALFATVVLASLGLSPHIYIHDQSDWRQIGAILDGHARDKESIVVYRGTVPEDWFTSIYYLAAAHYSHVFPRPLMKLSGPASPALVHQLPDQTAWLITSLHTPAPADVLPGTTVIEQYDVPGLATCYHLKLPA